ncbi:hypothetical protein PanWU01x14_202100 [Parasponia andersonii]|uniref:Uncharacterized protein n=1 Tax=Parasponia andersonii TaxID=3476 RepID=A0A2P5BXH5_PARAD|nr:hypothetical protein PanWU01x14_202100 [Parasponia andersonii]
MHLKHSSQWSGVFLNGFSEGLYWVDLETLDSTEKINCHPFLPKEDQTQRMVSILSYGGCNCFLVIGRSANLAIWNLCTRRYIRVLPSNSSVYDFGTFVIRFSYDALNDNHKFLVSITSFYHCCSGGGGSQDGDHI